MRGTGATWTLRQRTGADWIDRLPDFSWSVIDC
jgi:hypothetical protein